MGPPGRVGRGRNGLRLEVSRLLEALHRRGAQLHDDTLRVAAPDRELGAAEGFRRAGDRAQLEPAGAPAAALGAREPYPRAPLAVHLHLVLAGEADAGERLAAS